MRTRHDRPTRNLQGGAVHRLQAQINALLGPQSSWTSWTPVITGSPGFTNNGSAWNTVGKTMFLRFNITLTSVGSGSYAITLPNSAACVASPVGAVMLRPTSAMVPGFWIGFGTAITMIGNAGAVVGSSNSAAGEQIAFTGVIETS